MHEIPTATTRAAVMEVASPSPSPPPPSKLPLRINPAALLLRHLPTPPPTTAPAVMSPPRPSANPLTSFLSSLILRLQRPKQPSPPPPHRAAEGNGGGGAAAGRVRGAAVPTVRGAVAVARGARAWLSRMFPCYGHDSRTNWSSGKETGSVLWDRRPVNHLDFCYYCHNMASDTHDQAQLLCTDLAFLRCLEAAARRPPTTASQPPPSTAPCASSAAESKLSKFVEVNDEYMKTLEILSKKIKFIEADPMVKSSKALKDVQPEVERLRQKAVSKGPWPFLFLVAHWTTMECQACACSLWLPSRLQEKYFKQLFQFSSSC